MSAGAPQRKIPLPPVARATFDKLARVYTRDRLAHLLGCMPYTVDTLYDGGHATPATIAKITAALGRVRA
jgi:hypothetical protein